MGEHFSVGMNRSQFLRFVPAAMVGVATAMNREKPPLSTESLTDGEINKVWKTLLVRFLTKQKDGRAINPLLIGATLPALNPRFDEMDYFFPTSTDNGSEKPSRKLTFQKMRRRLIKTISAIGAIGALGVAVEKTVGWENVARITAERGLSVITPLLKKQLIPNFAAPLPGGPVAAFAQEVEKTATPLPVVATVTKQAADTLESNSVIIDNPKPTAALLTAKATANPTVTPEKPMEIIGDKSAIEYYFQPLINYLIGERQKRALVDPAFLERIGGQEKLNQNRLNIVLVGIDQSKNTRPDEYQQYGKYGIGRADMVTILSINPKTTQTTIISLPRDLYSPEVEQIKQSGRRVNGMTMVGKTSSDWEEKRDRVITQTIESATGLPIDGTAIFNTDLISDFEGHQSFFSVLFPDGLPVLLTEPIYDEHMGQFTCVQGQTYPCMVNFDGGKITDYIRARYHSGGSDFQRQTRMQNVIKTMIPAMAKRLINFKNGFPNYTNPLNWNVIKQSLACLRKQTETNKKSDQYPDLMLHIDNIDFMSYLEQVIDDMEEKMKTTEGKGQLAALFLNLLDKQKEDNQLTGISIADIVSSGQNKGDQYLLHFTETYDERLIQTQLGNYMKYWKPLRERVMDAMK